MSTLGTIVLALVALLVLLVLGGIVASGRAARARESRLATEIDRANAALARAHAGDNGWDVGQMEAAARTAWSSAHHAGEAVAALHLVQVIDRPGTDADEAVYRVVGTGGHEHDIVLKRSGAGWAS